jgi:hypothetical protein
MLWAEALALKDDMVLKMKGVNRESEKAKQRMK